MKLPASLIVSLGLAFMNVAFCQAYDPRIVNDDAGNKYGVWIVKYSKEEFAAEPATSERNKDICVKLRVTNNNGQLSGTLWRYRDLSANGQSYLLRGGGAGRITGMVFTIGTQGTDRKRERFSSNEVAYVDEQGAKRTVKLVGSWHTGKVKKQNNNTKNRHDDVLHVHVIDKPAIAGGNKPCSETVELVMVLHPCPEEPDSDVLEEEMVPDPEASPPYDGP